MANRDMLKWQSNVLSHLDDSDSESDKESALSGSFMVDSVMNDLKKRGYRNNNLYRGDEFHLDPVAEATGDEMTASEREYEKDMRLKHMAKPVTTTQSHSQTVPRNYQHHQLPVANGNHHPSGGIGFTSSYHSQSSHQLDQQQHGDRSRYNQQPAGGYHATQASQGSYGRPDSRGGGSYRSSNEHLAGHFPSGGAGGRHGSFETPPTVSRNQQLVDARAGLPSAVLGASLGALTRLPAPGTPTMPPAAFGETGREDFVRHRSRSLGKGSHEQGDTSGSYHARSGSLPRSDRGGGHREPDLHEVVEFLQSRDSSLVAYAASYLQHLAYGDDAMKMRIRDHGAIPILIGLLRHNERKVQLAVLGALRNLSFGRMNDTNKLTIAQDHGLLELIYQLRSSRSAEVRELVTGVLWNLSSCEHLKMNIIKAGLVDVINYVLLRCSSWSPEQAANPDVKPNNIMWTTELCNATGMLRNVSSAGEEARLSLRSARSLVDALLWIVRGAIGNEESNNKTVENIMCILRNLSYRIENEVDPQEGLDDTMDKDWEMQQMREMDEERRLFEKHSNKSKQSTFSLCTKPQTRESLAATLSAREEQLIQQTRGPAHMMMRPKRLAPLYGTPLLWQPDTVCHYISILTDTANPETQEAACGAIHNLTACVWKWAAYQRKMIRLCDGLPVIVSLTISESDAVTRAAVTALRNLSIDLLNKAIIGQLATSKLISRLPFGSRHQGLTDPTVVAVICALIELVSESSENIRYFRQAGGAVLVSRLAKSKQHPMKIVYAANKLCSLICEDREGRQALKKEHWDISIYSKLAREVGSQFDFEPRSTSKEVKGVRRGSKRNSSGRKKEKSSSESKSPAGKRKSPIQSKKGVPHRSITDILPPTPGQLPAAEPEAGARYEAVDSRQQRQVSVPALQYAAISEDEKATVIQAASQNSRRSEPPQPAVPQPQPLPPQEAASLYAAVDMEKKRAERRYAGQPRDRRPQQPNQQHPFKPAPVGADSWV